MSPACWQNDFENSQWQEVLHLFTVVKNLYLSEEFFPHTVPTLQEPVMGGTKDVSPHPLMISVLAFLSY